MNSGPAARRPTSRAFNADVAGRPPLIRGNRQLLFGGMARVSENSTVLKNKSHAITCDIEVRDGDAKGVIISQGWRIRRVGSYPFGSRLPRAAEQRLAEEHVIDCALGVRGCSPRGTPPQRLERISAESDLAFTLYGRALLGRPVMDTGSSGTAST